MQASIHQVTNAPYPRRYCVHFSSFNFFCYLCLCIGMLALLPCGDNSQGRWLSGFIRLLGATTVPGEYEFTMWRRQVTGDDRLCIHAPWDGKLAN